MCRHRSPSLLDGRLGVLGSGVRGGDWMKAFRLRFHDQPENTIVFHETRDKAVNAVIHSLLTVGYGSTYREAMARIKSRRRAPEYDELAKSQPKGRSLDERYVKEFLYPLICE
jgi:hypothetical protein